MANNWAIIIGINHYDHHPERQLKYAVPDAQLIYDFLSTQAGFAPDHILLCLGDEAHRTHSNYPTYATLLRLLNRDLHPSRIGQVDRLWFFFGGHGVSQNGRDYLLTADSLIEDVELKIALPIDEVIASLRKHQNADIVLILDNCRQLQGSRKLSAGEVGKQTVELAHSRGITTIFSCDYGQYSYELESVKQGAFTYALVEGLKHHTLPDQLEQYLRRRVAELNQRHDQVPRIRVEPASKALQPLLPSAVTAADITVLVERAREAELEEDFETSKQIWWEVIEVAQSGKRIQEARTAIDRIDKKIGGRSVPISLTPSINSRAADRLIVNRQLTRQQFFKWAIPAGVGVVGVTLASQFFGNSPRQLSPESSEAISDPEPIVSASGSNPSPVSMDYSKLEEFLKAGQWREADQETANLILKVTNRGKEGWSREDIQNFPCGVLRQIDRLWMDNSGGKFGISVQRKIYVENCGGELDGQFYEEAWNCFGNAVGWIVNNQWILPTEAIFNISAKEGHLPFVLEKGYSGSVFGTWWVSLLRC